MNPEKARIEAARSTEMNPAIGLLRKTLSSGKDAEDGFRKWRENAFTQMFVRALAELADTPPEPAKLTDANGVLVQYGMTSGLNLAYKLFTQPQRLYPEVFRGDYYPAEDFSLAEVSGYTDSQDSVIQEM